MAMVRRGRGSSNKHVINHAYSRSAAGPQAINSRSATLSGRRGSGGSKRSRGKIG